MFQAGGGKRVYLFKNYALGFYKDSDLYKRSQESYQANANQLVFPFAKVVSWNDYFELVIMQRIHGNHFSDKEHDDLVIQLLFEYAVESPIRSNDNGNCLYLQHGDVKRDNIIWVSEKEFVFIDLDNVSYKPFLYDVLKYCNHICMTLREIENAILSNKPSIIKIYKKANLEFDESKFVDSIFYGYVSLYASWGRFYGDLEFLNCDAIKNYPRTYELLQTLKL